jgi:hypothetical protein
MGSRCEIRTDRGRCNLKCIEERWWTILVRERVLREKISEIDRRVCGKQLGRVLMDRVRV